MLLRYWVHSVLDKSFDWWIGLFMAFARGYILELEHINGIRQTKSALSEKLLFSAESVLFVCTTLPLKYRQKVPSACSRRFAVVASKFVISNAKFVAVMDTLFTHCSFRCCTKFDQNETVHNYICIWQPVQEIHLQLSYLERVRFPCFIPVVDMIVLQKAICSGSGRSVHCL